MISKEQIGSHGMANVAILNSLTGSRIASIEATLKATAQVDACLLSNVIQMLNLVSCLVNGLFGKDGDSEVGAFSNDVLVGKGRGGNNDSINWSASVNLLQVRNGILKGYIGVRLL
jgi:hypothetical protein